MQPNGHPLKVGQKSSDVKTSILKSENIRDTRWPGGRAHIILTRSDRDPSRVLPEHGAHWGKGQKRTLWQSIDAKCIGRALKREHPSDGHRSLRLG